jgi:hypothetical protein
MGPLTEGHRCSPRGTLTRLGDAVTTIGIGGIAGAIVCFAIEERPAGALVLAAVALGAVLASAVRQAISSRP